MTGAYVMQYKYENIFQHNPRLQVKILVLAIHLITLNYKNETSNNFSSIYDPESMSDERGIVQKKWNKYSQIAFNVYP